ncbi:hypothetical protein ACFRSX_38060 [Streptomyces goshikiensis]|uniref:hypothetical protein n=1 Tax=Streptomyces TaxID=1883 RepID=UPI0009623D91|nr:hypothetical protein [Streptomyces sp. CB02120-2]OKI41738.1 hypothetical protein A6A28_24400 [Streptomyces sp. CB03578]
MRDDPGGASTFGAGPVKGSGLGCRGLVAALRAGVRARGRGVIRHGLRSGNTLRLSSRIAAFCRDTASAMPESA